MHTHQKAINLSTGDEMTFINVSPEYAVAYAYCAEILLTSWLLTHALNETLNLAYTGLPLEHGAYTVACGDWACLLNR